MANPRSAFLKANPKWRSAIKVNLRNKSLGPGEISWLREAGSLTKRIVGKVGSGFNVLVLQQKLSKPSVEESLKLGLRPSQGALVREVILRDRGEPLVLARSIIPIKTLAGADRRLAHLGNRPLGQILFNHPTLRRFNLEFARLEIPRDLDPAWLSGQSASAMIARRSVYAIKPGHLLLVAEYFLPALFRHDVPHP